MRDVGGKIPLPRLMRLSQLTLIGSARISTNGGMHPGRIYGREERSYKDGFRVYRQRAAKAWHFALGSLNAERDADNILERLLEQQAGKAGVNWFEILQQAILSLSHFPERCSLAPESRMFPFDVRHLLYGRKPHIYRILFTIEGETVHVLHIRHGRRQPMKH